MAHVRVLGIDIAKQIFHIVGMDDTGTVVLRKHCPRGALMSLIAQTPPVVIGMEACGGAHYWARRFREHGTVETSDRRDGAPVDDILATGDRGGAIRREEGDQLGHLCWPARTAQWDAAE